MCEKEPGWPLTIALAVMAALVVFLYMAKPGHAQTSGCMAGNCERSLPKFAQEMGPKMSAPADPRTAAIIACFNQHLNEVQLDECLRQAKEKR